MTDRVVSVGPDATVAEALSQMEQNGVHEMPVMQGADLKGWVSYRTLLRRSGVGPAAKVSTVAEQPPRIQRDIDLAEAANLMITNNVRALPVVDRKGKIVGVLSRTDVLRAAVDVRSIADLRLDAVMSGDLETATEEETVDQAVARLRALHLGQLLVLDGNGRLEGFVSLERLVRAHTAEHAPDTDRRGRGAALHSGRARGAKSSPRIELKGLVEDAPVLPPSARVREAIELVLQRGTTFVVVAEDGFAQGVVSRSNLVERVARLRPAEGVLCQVMGLNHQVDTEVLDAIHAAAQHTLQKIRPMIEPQFLTLHYKVYKAKAEGDSKFSLSAHLGTDARFFVQKSDAWDPIDAARQALDLLEMRVMEFKDRRLDRRKGPARRKADFYTATRA